MSVKQDKAVTDRDDGGNGSWSEQQDFDLLTQNAREACAKSSRLIEEFKRLQAYTARLHQDLKHFQRQPANGRRRAAEAHQ
jgi:hypothetical protein